MCHMSLDPEVKKFLDMMSTLLVFDPGIPVGKMRELELSGLSVMPKEEVGSIKDHRINDKGLLLREYIPSGSIQYSTILFIHGGGFVLGSVEAYDPFARHFCNMARMRLFSLEYRLAPENRFPAAHDDSFAAFMWLVDNAQNLKIDPGRITVMGDSAGGSLAAYVTHNAVNSGKVIPRFQVLLYPALGDSTSTASFEENGQGYLLTKDLISWFGKQYSNLSLPEKDMERYRIKQAGDPSKFPRTLVITAQFDPLRDSGEKYASDMMEFGANVTSIRANGMIHGFITNYLMIHRADYYLRAIAAILNEE